MNVAYAHGGHNHDEIGGVLDHLWDWAFDPTAVIIAIALVLYLKGVRHYRRVKPIAFPRWRVVFFTVGCVIMFLALCSPVDFWADRFFSIHMIQHMLIMMVGVPMVLLGRPNLPLVRGVPAGIRRTAVIPLLQATPYRKIIRVLTKPPVAFGLFALNFWIWHHPPFYDAALLDTTWHLTQHAMFFWTSVLFWWNIVDPYPLNATLAPLGKMIWLIFVTIQNSALGGLLTFGSTVHYAYQYVARPAGAMDLLEDQTLGGIIMWVPGSMMYLVAFSVVFLTMAWKQTQDEPLYQLPTTSTSTTSP